MGKKKNRKGRTCGYVGEEMVKPEKKESTGRKGMLGCIVGAISLFLFLVLFIQVYLMSTIVQWCSLPLMFWLFHAFVALLSFYLSFRFIKSSGVIFKTNLLLSSVFTVLMVAFVFNLTDNRLGERKESVTDVKL